MKERKQWKQNELTINNKSKETKNKEKKKIKKGTDLLICIEFELIYYVVH